MSTPASSTPPSPGLRRFLLLTAAVTGASIMIVEILGAKMLAPYIGTSHFVWTAQIGVTLVALALGYAVGGRVADRSPGVRSLYGAVLMAALYLALSVWWCEPVAFWCIGFSLPVGSLLAATILYLPPLAFLAMTPPFLVRALTTSLDSVGASVGRLSAISTLGSVAGTVLIGYVLIPLLPNSRIMFLVSATLAVVAVAYFLVWDRRRATQAVVAGVIGVGVGLQASNQAGLRPAAEMKEVFRGNSNFGMIQVLEMASPGLRAYLNDRLTQNTYVIEGGRSGSLFTYLLKGLAHVYTPEVRDALCIGMGVGIVPMELARQGVRVEVVEINDAIVPVAQRFFGFDPTRLQLTVGDGRPYLAASTNRYDTILLDAFLGESVPAHLMTREALQLMRQHLKPGGTLVMNTIADTTIGRDYFITSLVRTLHAVFPEVRVHMAGDSGFGNIFVVAGDRPGLAPVRPPDLEGVPPGLLSQVQAAYDGVRHQDPQRGAVLTDDFNPVEYHDAGTRERFRHMLAENAMKGH